MSPKASALALLATALAAPALGEEKRREVPEPAVQHTVIEDDRARIEELRVRGLTQRIVVTPKVGPRARYEILPGDALREPPAGGSNAVGGTAGQRVWNVLAF